MHLFLLFSSVYFSNLYFFLALFELKEIGFMKNALNFGFECKVVKWIWCIKYECFLPTTVTQYVVQCSFSHFLTFLHSIIYRQFQLVVRAKGIEQIVSWKKFRCRQHEFTQFNVRAPKGTHAKIRAETERRRRKTLFQKHSFKKRLQPQGLNQLESETHCFKCVYQNTITSHFVSQVPFLVPQGL